MISPRPNRHQRGSVVVIALWAIAIAALVTSAIQLTAYRQSIYGRESLERVQARWAARAGIEDSIAVLADHTFDPVPDDAFAMILDLENVALGEVNGATYEILHHIDGKDFRGPMDEHSKININIPASRTLAFETFRDMTIDIPDSISDWIDEDDDPSILGAERDYYLSLPSPYEPRNGPMHNITELELVAGIWPEYLRGEDHNLNNRLDPEENDGTDSLPEDEPDNRLDGGWASRLTVYSLDYGATASGLPRLYLKITDPEELMERLGINQTQADLLKQLGADQSKKLTQLYTERLASLATGGEENRSMQEDLRPDQVDAVLNEVSIAPPYERVPGRTNINTVSVEFLLDLLPDNEDIVDEIIYMRGSRPQGIVGMSELQDLPEMTDEIMEKLAELLTTTSNIYTITSRGRSRSSGIEVEMIVVVDRSTLPARIIEYREQ